MVQLPNSMADVRELARRNFGEDARGTRPMRPAFERLTDTLAFAA